MSDDPYKKKIRLSSPTSGNDMKDQESQTENSPYTTESEDEDEDFDGYYQEAEVLPPASPPMDPLPGISISERIESRQVELSGSNLERLILHLRLDWGHIDHDVGRAPFEMLPSEVAEIIFKMAMGEETDMPSKANFLVNVIDNVSTRFRTHVRFLLERHSQFKVALSMIKMKQIEKIPTDRVALFEYSVDWDMVDAQLWEERIRPWVNKKIKEYIGQPNTSLTELICSKVLARSSPNSVLEGVQTVLDQEAEVFVVQMWRHLIYETENKRHMVEVEAVMADGGT